MEPEHNVPNNLRHDSPPGLRRMSSLFKRMMRKEDSSVNSSKNIIVPLWKRNSQEEAENVDSTAGNRVTSWFKSTSDFTRLSSKDWRRGSGSSKSSSSSIFSRGRYSSGSTILSAATSARRSSGMSSTARLRRSGTFSVLAKTAAINEQVPCASTKSGKGHQEVPGIEDGQFVTSPCPDQRYHPMPIGPDTPMESIERDSPLGESEPFVDHHFTVSNTSPSFYDAQRPRPPRLSNSAEGRHLQPHIHVSPRMHESLQDNASWTVSSTRSTHVTEYDSTSASEYEDDLPEETQVLTPLTGLLVDKLLRGFYNDGILSSTNHISHGTSESSSPRSSQGGGSGESTSTHGHGARHRGAMGNRYNESNDYGGEEEEEGRPSKRVRSAPRELIKQPLLAGPFCKWKPLTYQRCYKYILKDISRVKQHLRRSHKKPPYCPKCWETFNDEESRDLHIQVEPCLPCQGNMPEGITAGQQEQLERRVDKKLSKADQWYSMFSILFPDYPRPSSPYIESDLSPELLSFQQFMGAEGLTIVEQTVRELIPPDLVPQQDRLVEFSQNLFQHAIPRILQHYESTRPNPDSSDSGYGSARSGGRVSREIERPILGPQGQRSIQPANPSEMILTSSFSFDTTALDSEHGTFTPFYPAMPAHESLGDFDMTHFPL